MTRRTVNTIATTYAYDTTGQLTQETDANTLSTYHKNYSYAVDDTSNPARWKTLPGTATLVTLFKGDGLIQGNHAFYLKAQDVAGDDLDGERVVHHDYQ
jgi:YD repeat-containing protein